MGESTGIAWTDHTANPWWGCAEVHCGCDHCYARVFAARVGKADAWEGVRYECPGVWKNLAKWQRDAAAAGVVCRVFCGSMMDVFEKPMRVTSWSGNPLGFTTGHLRDRLFNEVVPACPDLELQFLTKRPANVPKMVPPGWLKDWPANVITGTSVVDQPTADTLIGQLLKVPGRRFLSVEPLLAAVDLKLFDSMIVDVRREMSMPRRRGVKRPNAIHWVIVGGESGPHARPCDLAWIRSVVDQCRAAGVPCFVKQLGARASDAVNGLAGVSLRVPAEAAGLVSRRLKDSHGGDPDEWPEDLRVREFPARAAAACGAGGAE